MTKHQTLMMHDEVTLNDIEDCVGLKISANDEQAHVKAVMMIRWAWKTMSMNRYTTQKMIKKHRIENFDGYQEHVMDLSKNDWVQVKEVANDNVPLKKSLSGRSMILNINKQAAITKTMDMKRTLMVLT